MHAAAALLAAALAAAALPAQGQQPRIIEITARRFAFTPAELTLRRGEPVVLRVHSEDVTHGFFERKLHLDATLTPGRAVDLPLTPGTPGRYTVICDHFCGAGHGNMRLVITVVE